MTAADVLRPQLEAVGGLMSRGEMSKEWGLSRTHTHSLSHRPGFPQPVTHVASRPLYARHEVEAWWAAYREANPVREQDKPLGDPSLTAEFLRRRLEERGA